MAKITHRIIKRNIFDDIVSHLETDNIMVSHGSRQVGKISYFILFH